MDEFFAWLAQCGFAIKGEAPEAWQRRLTDIGEDNGLSPIKDFYTGDISAPPFPAEQAETLAELDELGAGFNVNYDTLFPAYVAYLRESGFLP